VAAGAPFDELVSRVPILAGGVVAGAFYLTDKVGADEFSDADQQLIERCAAHGALALENARTARALARAEHRRGADRLARELHDAVTQKLFGLVLAAESGAALIDRDAQQAVVQLELVREADGGCGR
jgi:signal transduction histidine kinase